MWRKVVSHDEHGTMSEKNTALMSSPFESEFWVSFASNPSVDPWNSILNQTWPQFVSGTDGQIMVFGNATGPGPGGPSGPASYVAPVAVADQYSGPC